MSDLFSEEETEDWSQKTQPITKAIAKMRLQDLNNLAKALANEQISLQAL